MDTLIQPGYQAIAQPRVKKISAIQRFVQWCEAEEPNRFGWLTASVGGHGCIVTPVTLFIVVTTGNNLMWWPLAIAAMAFPLIMNLAAQPMKVVLPVFFASLIVDVAIVIGCITALF